MEPLSRSPLHTFRARLGAGALGAAGCLVFLVLGWGGLSSAIGPFWVYLWGALSLACAALAVRFAHPEPARSRLALLGRVVSVLAIGVLLVFAVLAASLAAAGVQPFAAAGELPDGMDDIPVFYGIGAALLLALFLVTTPRRRANDAPQPAIADLPEGLLPAVAPEEPGARYALVGSGPAVTAEESERAASVVEVSLRWGEDLVRVTHLEPPRTFHVGGAGDELQVPCASFPVVLVEGKAASAVVPEGATALVREGAAMRKVEGDGQRIALGSDTRVTITVPTHATGSAYRGAGDGGSAPLVLEVALVRAGKVVGRGLHLRDGGRLFGSIAAAACAVGFFMLALAFFMAPCSCVDDEANPYRVREIQLLLEAAGLEHPEVEEPPPHYPHGDLDYGREDPFQDPADAELLSPNYFEMRCAAPAWSRGDPHRIYGRTSLSCASRVATPFGLRKLDLPAFPDPFGRDAADLWPFFHEQANLAAHLAPRAAVRIGAPQIRGAKYPSVFVERAARQSLGRLRLCYAEGLSRDRSLRGSAAVRLLVGRDGVVSLAANNGSDLSDHEVVRCMADAFEGLALPVPEAGVVTAVVPIQVGPGPSEPRP